MNDDRTTGRTAEERRWDRRFAFYDALWLLLTFIVWLEFAVFATAMLLIGAPLLALIGFLFDVALFASLVTAVTERIREHKAKIAGTLPEPETLTNATTAGVGAATGGAAGPRDVFIE